MKEIQKKLLESHVFYNQKYQSEGDRYFEGMCDGLDLAIQEIDKFIGADSDEVTFDDLINVAVQAVRDKVIYSFNFAKAVSGHDLLEVFETSVHKVNDLGHLFNDTEERVIEGINFIKSLYTETFVIKEFVDTKKLKPSAEVVLSNGEKVVFSNKSGADERLWFEYSNFLSATIPYIALKGATATQKRGKQ